MGVRYQWDNAYLIYRQIKTNIKDEEQGRMTREECAQSLHKLADRLVQLKPDTEQGRLEIDTPVKQGLRERGMI